MTCVERKPKTLNSDVDAKRAVLHRSWTLFDDFCAAAGISAEGVKLDCSDEELKEQALWEKYYNSPSA